MKLVKVQQRLCSSPIKDIEQAVRAELRKLGPVPKGRIALTGGSRGIANLTEIFQSAGKWLREQGAEPFIVPCMGSHNGGTAEGQEQMLKSIGLGEETTQMPICSSMDVCEVGSIQLDTDSKIVVWMDRHCYEADAVLAINRIKLHTGFGGPPYGQHCESGLLKMLTVGMGKFEGAKSFHAASTNAKPIMLRKMGEQIIATGKVWGGLGILEDGYDQTAELHGIKADEILEREPLLLSHYAETYYPRLPFEKLDSLVIETMGKNFSGTGMDTNIIGRRCLEDAEDPAIPDINCIAVLDLSSVSQGNANGVGLSDVITQGLADKIDIEKTRLNAITAGSPAKAVIPNIVDDDAAIYDWIQTKASSKRCVVIPNTLHLDKFYVSEDLVEELNEENQESPNKFLIGEAFELTFRDGKQMLDW